VAVGVFVTLLQTVATRPGDPNREITSGDIVNGGILTNITTGAGIYLNNPQFAGITFTRTGQGNNARVGICFGQEQVGKKLKIYVNFGNTYYIYEIQVWEPGCWTIINTGSGPSTPNSIGFSNPVPIYTDWPPEEFGPGAPVPEYNPFQPWVVVALHRHDYCATDEIIDVQIKSNPLVAISSAIVYKDGQPTPVTLQQLQTGYSFHEIGDYQIVITYQFLGQGQQNPAGPPGQLYTSDFSIGSLPFPHIQMERHINGFLLPGEAVLFDTQVAGNGSIEYDEGTRTFTLAFCGDYLCKWFVATQSTLAEGDDGVDFALVVDVDMHMIASSHSEIGQVSGMAVFKEDSIPLRVSIVNLASGVTQMSSFTKVTASILIVKIGPGILTNR